MGINPWSQLLSNTDQGIDSKERVFCQYGSRALQQQDTRVGFGRRSSLVELMPSLVQD